MSQSSGLGWSGGGGRVTAENRNRIKKKEKEREEERQPAGEQTRTEEDGTQGRERRGVMGG